MQVCVATAVQTDLRFLLQRNEGLTRLKLRRGVRQPRQRQRSRNWKTQLLHITAHSLSQHVSANSSYHVRHVRRHRNAHRLNSCAEHTQDQRTQSTAAHQIRLVLNKRLPVHRLWNCRVLRLLLCHVLVAAPRVASTQVTPAPDDQSNDREEDNEVEGEIAVAEEVRVTISNAQQGYLLRQLRLLHSQV